MPLIECRFKSKVLQCDTCVRVILPDQPDNNTSTLYLLHGLSDDETAWTRKSLIERYVESLPLAVVMPGVGLSFYQDMRHGAAYWSYVSEELPERIQSLFKLPYARSKTFVAGLSMGGYGAFRLALTYPERFAAAASLSGALSIAGVAGKETRLRLPQVFENAFGSQGPRAGSGADLFHLASQLAKNGSRVPKLLQYCGTEDLLIEPNRAFSAHASGLGLPLQYIEGEGAHEWSYWDVHIQKVLNWLPLH